MDHTDLSSVVKHLCERSLLATPGTSTVVADGEDQVTVRFWGAGKLSVDEGARKTFLGAALIEALDLVMSRSGGNPINHTEH